MSEPGDDQAFEEYLGRGSQVSKRYRSLGGDEVPAALDSLVLAQARQAVAGKIAHARRRPAWLKWGAPLVTAASVVLVVAVVIEGGMEHPFAVPGGGRPVSQSVSVPVRNEAAPVADTALIHEKIAEKVLADEAESGRVAMDVPPAPPPAVPQASQGARRQKAASAAGDEVRVAAQRDIAPVAPAPVAPEPAIVLVVPVAEPPQLAMQVPAESPAMVANAANPTAVQRTTSRAQSDDYSVESVAASGSPLRTEDLSARRGGPRGTVPAATEDARLGREERTEETVAEAPAQVAREADPQRWLEYIRQLRRENKTVLADAEWRRFGAKYPQYKVDAKDTARPQAAPEQPGP